MNTSSTTINVLNVEHISHTLLVLDGSPCAQIFQEFKSTDMKYKTRLRSRISNLKDQKNPELRRNVLCGNISPHRIACMTAEVSASSSLNRGQGRSFTIQCNVTV